MNVLAWDTEVVVVRTAVDEEDFRDHWRKAEFLDAVGEYLSAVGAERSDLGATGKGSA